MKTKLTPKTINDIEIHTLDFEILLEEIEQSLNEKLTLKQGDKLSKLPKKHFRAYHKAIDGLYKATFEAQGVVQEINNWLSDKDL